MTVAIIMSMAACEKKNSEGETSVKLNVMQFNLQVSNADTSRAKAPAIRKIIDKYSPDVIGFQEVTPALKEQLDATTFAGTDYKGVITYRNGNDEAVPCYYNAAKFDLVDSGTFWLSDTPDVPGSFFKGVNCTRIATWTKLTMKSTGKSLLHVNVHLDHNGKNQVEVARELRAKQIAVALRFIHENNLPTIMTGDFNQSMSGPDGVCYPAYRLITGEDELALLDGTTCKMDFKNARFEAKDTISDDKTASMTKYYVEGGADYDPKHQPIDYIFYTDGAFAPKKFEMFMPTVDGITISDHLGLFCTFDIAE